MQSQPGTSPIGNVSLDRIRKGLQETPTLVVDTSSDLPRFRVFIVHYSLDLTVPWDPSDRVPDYVRPPRGLYHHEFLDTVTPEVFKAGVLYPGVDILGLARQLGKSLNREFRRRQEETIRKQIEEELRQLEAARKKAGGTHQHP